MTLYELFLIALGLSMDAFAVSVCKGLSVQKLKIKHFAVTGLFFGGFQAIMPFLGYLAGYSFQNVISSFDYIIAFLLLSIIGFNMIKESQNSEEEKLNGSFSFFTMLPLAVATSIDALAVGVTFAALGFGFTHKITSNILFAISVIGVTTFIISDAGLKIGNIFGTKYKKKAELAGGIILILIGIKIFIEHFVVNS